MESELCNWLPLLYYVACLLKSYEDHKQKKRNLSSSFACQNIKILSHHIQESYLRKIDVLCEYDPNGIIIVPLYTGKGQSPCSGYRMCRFHSESSDKACLRWVHFIHCDQLSNRCIISEVLYHNVSQAVGLNFSIDLSVHNYSSGTYYMDRIFFIWNKQKAVLNEQERNYEPSFAKQAEVSFMDTSEHSYSPFYDDLLKDYFKFQKIVAQDDVLAIDIPQHLSILLQKETYLSYGSTIYFKVKSVQSATSEESDTYLVKQSETTLMLSVPVKGKVPLPSFHCVPNYNTFPVVPCLFREFCRLVSLTMTIRELHCPVGKAVEGSVKETLEQCTSRECGKSNSRPVAVSSDAADQNKQTSRQMSNFSMLFGGHILIIGPQGIGKKTLCVYVAAKFGSRLRVLDAWAMKGDNSTTTVAYLRQAFQKIHPGEFAYISNVDVLGQDRDGSEVPKVSAALSAELKRLLALNPPAFTFCGTSSSHLMTVDLWNMFTYHEKIDVPDYKKRLKTLEWFFDSVTAVAEIRADSAAIDRLGLETLAQHTSGFILSDFKELFQCACRGKIMSEEDCARGSEASNTLQYVLQALDDMEERRSSSLALPGISKVKWSEIGGLENAKMEIINTIQLPLKFPSLTSSYLRCSGVLLHGPPGTGKTLLAKAVASECKLNFLSVKGPELLNMYVGQSEQNVRDIFAQARECAPCVIFFDELDSLAANRGKSGDSGGVMDRIVSALLTELDWASSSSDVFVLGATNRLDLIDPALLRPGRFEKQIYLGVPRDDVSRLKILRAVCAKLPVSTDVSLPDILVHLPQGMTGADFAAFGNEAFYNTLRKHIETAEGGYLKEPATKVEVTVDDFLSAVENVIPSISPSDIEQYEKINTFRY